MNKLIMLFLIPVAAFAQQVPSAPRGVYSLVKGGAATARRALSSPDVDGISLRLRWEDVNPAEDVYHWSYFDAEITKAQNAGKKVLIRIVDGGKDIPDWVVAASSAAGEPTFSFLDPAHPGTVVTEPVFWAPTLLGKKAKAMRAFGKRYNSNPTVAIVICQFAGATNDEWNVPHDTTVDGLPPAGSTQTSRWLAAGYTTAKMIDAGIQVVNSAMRAFRDKPVGLAIGPTSLRLDPLGKDFVAQTVISNSRAMWGNNRMVATKNSISATMPVPPPAIGTYWRPLWDSQPAVAGQMLWFTYNDSTYRNNGGVPADPTTVLENAVDLAHGYGLNYLEIYQADCVGLTVATHYAHILLNP